MPPNERPPEDPGTEKQPEEKREEKWFQLDVSPSDFVHEKYIKSSVTNPLHGPYKPVRPERSFIAGALRQTVAPSLWARGLMDWETDAVKRRGGTGLEADFERNSNGYGASGSSDRPAKSFQERYRKRQEMAVPAVMKGLRALREERQRSNAGAIRADVG